MIQFPSTRGRTNNLFAQCFRISVLLFIGANVVILALSGYFVPIISRVEVAVYRGRELRVPCGADDLRSGVLLLLSSDMPERDAVRMQARIDASWEAGRRTDFAFPTTHYVVDLGLDGPSFPMEFSLVELSRVYWILPTIWYVNHPILAVKWEGESAWKEILPVVTEGYGYNVERFEYLVPCGPVDLEP